MLYVIPEHSMFSVHSKLISWHKVVLLSPQFPILMTFAFFVFTFNPEIDWNFVRTAMPSLKTDSLVL